VTQEQAHHALGIDSRLVAAQLGDLPDDADGLAGERVEVLRCDARGGDCFCHFGGAFDVCVCVCGREFGCGVLCWVSVGERFGCKEGRREGASRDATSGGAGRSGAFFDVNVVLAWMYE
jgi:hypothetical protein